MVCTSIYQQQYAPTRFMTKSHLPWSGKAIAVAASIRISIRRSPVAALCDGEVDADADMIGGTLIMKQCGGMKGRAMVIHVGGWWGGISCDRFLLTRQTRMQRSARQRVTTIRPHSGIIAFAFAFFSTLCVSLSHYFVFVKCALFAGRPRVWYATFEDKHN